MNSPTSKKHKQVRRALKRENRHSPSEKYSLEKSPLYELGGPRELADLLKLPMERIKAVAAKPTYHFFEKPAKQIGKKPRHIQDPLEDTQILHYRFAKLLNRIIRPAFLHSATKGRSHLTNAEAHKGPNPVICTDIEKFYENTTRAQVKAFLLTEMRWPVDLAATMADALTINGHLPTGSAVSPILSYLTHRKIFAEIEVLCLAAGCVLTLYIDDITVSGLRASSSLLRRIKNILLRQGLRTKSSKDKLAPTKSAIVITGAVRDGDSLRIRNEHRKGIVDLLTQYAGGDLEIEDRLASKIASVNCFDPAGAAPLKRRFIQMRAEAHRK